MIVTFVFQSAPHCRSQDIFTMSDSQSSQLTEELQSRAGKGRNGSVRETLPAIEALLEHVERLKEEALRTRVSESRRTAINNCWKVIDKYYQLTDQVPNIYFTATVLNPTLRLQYFESRWTTRPLKAALDKHKKTMTTNWKRDYSNLPVVTTTAVSYSIPGKRTVIEAFLDRSKQQATVDELIAYLRDPMTRVRASESFSFDLFKWWDDHSVQYPTLSQMAFDVLSIPAMSAECERVFSGAGALVTHRKKRMREDIIEAIECLRSWWRQDIISQVTDSDDEEVGEEDDNELVEI